MDIEVQERLRTEVSALPETKLSYGNVVNELPYLDAVVREVIRLHPIPDIKRVVSTFSHLREMNDIPMARQPRTT